ncbi:MAG: amidase [Sphingomonadaceae bacterium]
MNLTRRTVLAAAGVAAASTSAFAQPALARKVLEMDALLENRDSLGLAELVRKGEISASELLEDTIRRAEAINPALNFMAQKHYDYGRKAIANGLPDGPFTGVPWLLKDLHTFLKGELTEGGSRLYKGYRGPYTSEIVQRAEQAGFVIFGKTTTPEYGLTGTTESTLSGKTRNPWNPERIAGGSSGGAAVAVASGVLPAAHASDGGGSIRIPASCCGLFGLKPSRGRVPMGPGRTEGWGGLSTHHAISRSVRDSAAILDVTHGVEPGSRYGAPSPDGTFLSHVGRDPGRLRIALMTSPVAGSPVDAECKAAAQAAARLCESLGHHVEEAAPELDAQQLGFAAFTQTAPFVSVDVEDRCKALGIEPSTDVLEPITMGFVEYGKTFSARDMARGNGILQAAAITVAQFMADYDLILSPTMAEPPLMLGTIDLSSNPDFATWGARTGAFAPFTQLFNMTGQPAMSVPLSMSEDGLPIGVMFAGRYGEEGLLFQLAGQLEQAAPWADRRPA